MGNDYLDKKYWNGLIKISLSRLFILRVLYDEPLHGYEISRRISRMTNGCCAPTEGTLYPVLKEFEKEGYIICKTETVGGRSRKVCTLTEKGVRACCTGIEAWKDTAQVLLDVHEKLCQKEDK